MREVTNALDIKTRAEFRAWLMEHAYSEKECWVCCKRGKPIDEEHFWYLDAVEEALCFGWIDSTLTKINSVSMQRFSPRQKKSPWTELNKERVRRLEYRGLMTDAGRAVLPAMGPRSFKADPEIMQALKKARVWSKFKAFPPLYQRVRLYNLSFYKDRNMKEYEPALQNLIEKTRQGKTYGEWNDYGRLLDYDK